MADSKKNLPFLMGSHEGRQGRIQIGTLTIRRDGLGLIRPLAGGQAFIAAREEALKAMDGDLVRFEILRGAEDAKRSRGDEDESRRHVRGEARIVEVLEQRRQMAIGRLTRQGKEAFLVLSDRRAGGTIRVQNAGGFPDGALVKALVDRTSAGRTRNGAPGESARCKIIDVLPPSASLTAELLSAYAQGFSDVFSKAALKEAESLPGTISESERTRRLDLTGIPFITIDSKSARDFDDAVFAEELSDEPGAFRLRVAIADVAHYVKRGGPIDKEALRRGTSVYFPALVLPMLPERLSNGLCSLIPGEERLALSVEMVFVPGEDGLLCRTAEAVLSEAVIKSAARCTYSEVEDVLSGASSPWRSEVTRSVRAMGRLAKSLIGLREKNGGIDLNIPARAVRLGRMGEPEAIEETPRLFSHRLIEAFMLAANEAVAEWFEARELPTIYRVHGRPDPKKLFLCLKAAQAHGLARDIRLDTLRGRAEAVSGAQIAAFARELSGHPLEMPLSSLLLRAMAQAIYSPHNIGHFGLASGAYLHFTSPIRRYPDLEVHRRLKAALQKRSGGTKAPRKVSAAAQQKAEESLDAIAGRSSERERAAMACERDVFSWAAACLARKHIGETFEATVTAVTDFGAFALIGDIGIEGLILPEAMNSRRVELDPDAQRVTLGRGRVLTLGSRVRVRIDGADPALRHVDLSLM